MKENIGNNVVNLKKKGIIRKIISKIHRDKKDIVSSIKYF